MKRLSLLLAVPLALCLMGADAPSTYTTSREVTSRGRDTAVAYIQLIEMGGCQYVVAACRLGDGGVSIVHHAACTNPVHTVKPSTP